MMLRYLGISLVLASFTAGVTLRAATQPHAARAPANSTWMNDDVERLSKVPGLISVVGQPTNQAAQDDAAPDTQSHTRDAAWYAAQAASLNASLESEQADLRNFTEALNDARELKATTGGVNLFGDEVAVTPEDTIDILQSRVRETQAERVALEDLARRNGSRLESCVANGRAFPQRLQFRSRNLLTPISAPTEVIHEHLALPPVSNSCFAASEVNVNCGGDYERDENIC